MRPNLYLCEEEVQRTGTRFSKRWWEQEGLNLDGSQEFMAAALEEEPYLPARVAGEG